MSSLTDLPRVLRFGLFEVDLRAHELRRGGVKLKLQEQPFEVLAFGAARRSGYAGTTDGRRVFQRKANTAAYFRALTSDSLACIDPDC